MSPASRGTNATYRRVRRIIARQPLISKCLLLATGFFSTLLILQQLTDVQILSFSPSTSSLPISSDTNSIIAKFVHPSSASTSSYTYDSRQAEREEREATLLASKPAPLVVVAAGLPRTGSTWIYNILRILMRIRDPNSIAGWYADLQAIWKNHKTHKYDHMEVSWLEAYRSLGTSILLKMHGPSAFRGFSRGDSLSTGANLTVLTHRDLRTEVRSWVYQNWNSSIHKGEIAKTPFIDPDMWVQIAHKILRERNTTLDSVGTGCRLLDIKYEDWNHKPEEVQLGIVQQLADALDWDFTITELKDAVLEAKRIHPPRDGARLMYNPVSKLHPGHRRVNSEDPAFVQALELGYKAIEDDEISGRFLRENGYM